VGLIPFSLQGPNLATGSALRKHFVKLVVQENPACSDIGIPRSAESEHRAALCSSQQTSEEVLDP
jgi:hypothetical protein